MNTINLKLSGLTCEACVKLASKRLLKVPGVKNVDINLMSGETKIESDIEIDQETLQKSFEGTSYKIVK